MEQLRIGIIGIGGMGTHHANYLFANEVPGAKLAAVCDVSPDRLEYAKATFGEDVKRFATPDALFEANAVDAVMIATPHYDHPPLVMEALKRGLHALSEKPAGVYTRQVREMNEAAARSDRVFGIMFNQRTLPIHQKFKELVESGELGAIQRTNWIITTWFRSQSYYDSGGWRATWRGEGGGVLLNQCPHNLDLWQWIAGMPVKVRAFCSFGKYHDIEVEDDVTAYVEYANGATGVFVTTTGDAPGSNRLEVTGERGKIVMEDGKLTFWRTRQNVAEFCRTYKGGFGSPESWKCDIPVAGGGEQHKGITKNWVDAIRKGTPLMAPGAEGINSLTLSNAMLLSAWTDSTVDLPIDEDLFHAELQKRIDTSRFQKKSEGKTLQTKGTFNA